MKNIIFGVAVMITLGRKESRDILLLLDIYQFLNHKVGLVC